MPPSREAMDVVREVASWGYDHEEVAEILREAADSYDEILDRRHG